MINPSNNLLAKLHDSQCTMQTLYEHAKNYRNYELSYKIRNGDKADNSNSNLLSSLDIWPKLWRRCWDNLQRYNDERILKYDYNHDFKIFEIYHICPKSAFIKTNKGYKRKPLQGSNPQTTNNLSTLPLTELLGRLSNIVQIKPIN